MSKTQPKPTSMDQSPPTGTTRMLRPGDYLFHENEPANSLFIIKSGTVSIRKRRGHAYVELAHAFSNEVIGEVAFFDRRPRSASVVAIAETEVIELSFESLDRICAGAPKYILTIMAAMAERLRKADELVKKLKPETITERGKSADDETEESATSVLAETADVLGGGVAVTDPPVDDLPTEPAKSTQET